MKHIKLFFWGLFLLIAFDALWFGFFANNFYRSHLGALLRPSLNWSAALLAWVLVAAGLILFVVPRVFHAPYLTAFLYGAAYGFIVYGVYNFTNYATIPQWPVAVVLVDLAWGTFVNGLLSVLLCEIARMIK